MYVSIINTDPTSKSLSCMDAKLYISTKDIMENPFDSEEPQPLVFDVGEKYRNIVRYMRRLKSSSEELAISIGLLHNLVYTKGNMTERNLEDYFPGMTFNKKSNVLQGIYEGEFEAIVLDDVSMDILEELRALYEACVGRVYPRPMDMTCHVTSRVWNFIDRESCLIGREIYRQMKRMEQFRVDYVPVTIRELYSIKFSNLPKFIYNQYLVVTNTRTGQYAHIGGLSYDNLTKTLSIASNKMDREWFTSYLQTSLDAIGLDISVGDLCMDIITAINSYRDAHHSIPGDEMGNTSSIFGGVENVDYSKMYPSMDDENDDDKTIEDDCGTSISMDNLKWLLLYIADIVAQESYTSISHALSVYVYKDNNGKLSATFNNMEPTLVGIDEVKKFNKYLYKFKIYPISDIMLYYNSTEMEYYKRFIGTRPDIRVIIDDDIIIN